MSFQFDWETLKPFIERKLREAIMAIQPGVSPMLTSGIELISLDLGNSPPEVVITGISSLTLREQKISASFKYSGHATFEVKLDLNINALGARADHVPGMKYMGMAFAYVPMNMHCRFLISNLDLDIKLGITHGAQTYIEFEEPPVVKFSIDSNIGKLGIIFDKALQRVERIIKQAYAQLPPKIAIDMSKNQ